MPSAPRHLVPIGLLFLLGCGGSEFTSSGAGGSSTSATSTAATGTVSTGTSMSDEDCTNGVDDNGDGRIDCADPQCTSGGFDCIEKPPAGWNAVELATKPSAGILPQCDSGFPMAFKGDTGTLTAKPAVCSKCGCDDPMGQTCGLPTFTFDSKTCDGAYTSVTPKHVGDCESIPANAAMPISITAGIVPIVGGSCNGNGGDAVVPPASWSDKGEVCEAPALGEGCAANHVCAPKPSSGFASKVCLAQKGDLACPPGPFGIKTVVYLTTDDTRGCSACKCGDPKGATCNAGTANFYFGDTCDMTYFPVQAGMCETLGAPISPGAFEYTPGLGGTIGGSCLPIAATGPIGQAAGGTPVTVCCE